MPERRSAGDAVAVVIAIVGAIRQVEGLGDELKIYVLANSEVLGEADIQLEEGVAAQGVIFGNGAIRSDAVDAVEAVLSTCVIAGKCKVVGRVVLRNNHRVDVSATTWIQGVRGVDQRVGPGRTELEDGSELEAPGEIHDAAQGNVVALVVQCRSPVVAGEISPVLRGCCNSWTTI